MTMSSAALQVTVEQVDNQLIFSRHFNATPAQVFDAWTQPEKIGQWWGPDGFTTTTEIMDFRVGGEWRFVMHGPDGRDYPNKVIYSVIDPPNKLVFSHPGDEAVCIEKNVTFEAVEGGTRVLLRLGFASAEELKQIAVENGAIDGGQQTLTRLAGYLDVQ